KECRGPRRGRVGSERPCQQPCPGRPVVWRQGQASRGLDDVQTSPPLRRKLVASDPTDAKYQSVPSSGMMLAASILLRLGRPAERRTRLEEAIGMPSGAVKGTADYRTQSGSKLVCRSNLQMLATIRFELPNLSFSDVS